jgi:hypothetical protein
MKTKYFKIPIFTFTFSHFWRLKTSKIGSFSNFGFRFVAKSLSREKKHWSFKEDKMVKKGWQGAGTFFFPRLFVAFFLIFKGIFVYSQSDDHL